MIKAILDFFKPPVFPDNEQQTRSAYYINAVALFSLLVVSILLIVRLIFSADIFTPVNIIFIILDALLLLVFIIEKSGLIYLAGYLHIFVLWSAATMLAINGNGTAGNQGVRYVVIIAFAGLILGYRAAIWLTVISIVSIFGVTFAETFGLIKQQVDAPFVTAAQVSLPLVLSAVFIYLSLTSLQSAIKKVKDEAQEIEKNNKELKDLHETLEARIQERKNEFIKANAENNRRAAQFQTAAQITQKIASERNLDTLLPVITEVISSQFGYYHVGIYLNDDIQEYTTLSAANSKEGKHMVEHEHKLTIGQAGIIEQVAKGGVFNIVPDTEADETYVKSKELGETRSALAVPLRIGSEVIGVLDVQSKEVNAFDQIDIEALITLANQTTIAIQNARLFGETQTALAESQLLYGTVVKQAWEANMRTAPQMGYRYAGIKAIPLDKPLNTPEMTKALENGDITATHPSKRKEENALAVPVKLRDRTIGAIHIRMPVEATLAEDEIDIVSAAAQRISLALESASLLEESQRRAMREQNISEMSAKIGAVTDIETILQTAIRELGNQISGSQIMIEIGSEEEVR